MPARIGAEIVSIHGANGTAGADGADGDPGQPGAPGGDGESVEALADAVGEDNTARATGGRGGVGGDGGEGVPAGADAGDGGAGGRGGDATARALGSGALEVLADAQAGEGERGGAGGNAASPGTSGLPGPAGDAGRALAEASLTSDSSEALSARSFASGMLETQTSARVVQQGEGAATAVALGEGWVLDGADHAVRAYAESAGSEPVRAAARFEGLLSSSPTTARPEVVAEGHSSGGADVRVEAILAYPDSGPNQELGDAVLRDAVRGSTAGRLTLQQEIALGQTRAVGEPYQSLVAENPGGGDLSLDVARTGFLVGNSVLGDVIGRSPHGADVDVTVFMPAGAGGDVIQQHREPGAAARPSRIRGESDGGAVDVTVDFGGGSGLLPDLDGRDIVMENVADGDTTGALSLSQVARGGAGAIDFTGAPFVPPGGAGGSATSRLSKHTASASLDLFGWARAGLPAGGTGTLAAGDAHSVVDGSNSAGPATVIGRATGETGGPGGGDGGRATLEVSARTTGDGHAVRVGSAPFFPASPALDGALGGRGSGGVQSRSNPPFGDGGAASSRSSGVAEGDAPVEVWDTAVGGNGGFPITASSPDWTAGAGGAASSSATAQGGGASPVMAKSHAVGGNSLIRRARAARGGDAESFATATGLGHVEAWALAVGGNSTGLAGGVPARGGAASARASGDGASGFARAEAATGSGAEVAVRALAEAQLASRREVASRAAHGAALASASAEPGLHGFAFATGAPLAEDVDRALAGNAALADLFDAPGAEMLALARWQGRGAGDALATEIELILPEDRPAERLVLAAFELEVLGDGFETLSLSLARNGVALGPEQAFDSAYALRDFLAQQVLELGAAGWQAGDALRARFALAVADDTSVAIGLAFALVVPEPASGALLALGLLALARRRR